MDFKDKLKITGHVEILKIDNQTKKVEVVYEDPNVITGGLGRSIAQFMSTPDCTTVPCDPNLFGARPSSPQPGDENFTVGDDGLFGQSLDLDDDERDEYGKRGGPRCCIGVLDITAAVTFTPASPTSISFEATVQVDTTTTCDEDQPCTGHDSFGPTCVEKVDKFNETNEPAVKLNDSPTGGFNGEVISFRYMHVKKLGCCARGCVDKSNSEVHTFTGTIPGGTVKDGTSGDITARNQRFLEIDFGQQLISGFGFGGKEEEPEFQDCCTDPTDTMVEPV